VLVVTCNIGVIVNVGAWIVLVGVRSQMGIRNGVPGMIDSDCRLFKSMIDFFVAEN